MVPMMNRNVVLFAAVAAAASPVCDAPALAQTPSPGTQISQPGSASLPPTSARIAALHRLLSEQWEYTLRNNPEYASILGDRRYNDRLRDYSQQAVMRDLQQTRNFLRQFEAIDTAGFPVQEKLNRDL